MTAAEHKRRWLEAGIPYGYCLCGCGAKTGLAERTRSEAGWLRGLPYYFLIGHSKAKPHKYVVEDRGHDTPCWTWQGALTDKGYGTVTGDDGVSRLIHRLTYERHKGQIPAGLQLDHLCRVPACVNPAHLEAVPPAINSRRGNATKLTQEDVDVIRRSSASDKDIAARYGVNPAHVWRIRAWQVWRDVEVPA